MAATLRPHCRVPDGGELQFASPACVRAVYVALAPRKKLRLAEKEHADWISWDVLAKRINSSAEVPIDVGKVRDFLLQPISVEVSSSVQESQEEPHPYLVPAPWGIGKKN